MNSSTLLQAVGNICAVLAALVCLFPLQRLLRSYASTHLNDDRWVTPVLFVVIPLWVLLLGALLCVTASGGSDWLRLGRPALYTLTVAASGALAAVTFVFIALYIRPGFTPRSLYVPVIYLVPLTTALLVVLSLNPRFESIFPIQWLRLPWTIFAALSLVVGVGFFGSRLVNGGFGSLRNLVHHILISREAAPDHLARIATLDAQTEPGFAELLDLTDVHQDRATREAATARLREVPDFTSRLAAALENSRGSATALEFIEAATLTADEQKHLALPTRTALEDFINGIPAPNFITRSRQKELLRWGRSKFPVVIGKFTGTGVDFSQVMPAFEHALRPDDTRR